MKRNIPYIMLYRAIQYCSTFELFIEERETIRTALLLNKYPCNFIDKHFNRVLEKSKIAQPLTFLNYDTIREDIMNAPTKEKINIDYGKTLFVHFTYCSNMETFP
ncbi:unnamed protein product [Adineta steineri]|uniref:Helix-turn-helix domain-containing protein n=1 Tax=Adineta steineri TaxID=433720 RepID=A0A814DES5_9BILA|nr:unnamed protein product [Adineta steineri]CAF3834598.1 unnamed protein product [Adineta steineri]